MIGTTTDTTYVDPGIAAPHTYRVRAVDARGNKSATSDPVTVSPGGGQQVFVAAGSSWRWLTGGGDPGTAWRGLGFDDSTWAEGPAQLGFGDGDEATVVPQGNVEYYFRHSFSVVDPNVAGLQVELVADDGAVVYLNGTELVRENMAGGTLPYPAYPTGWKGSGTENVFTTYTVPATALVAGPNVVAVSVHNASARNGDLSFDLRLTEADTTPPQPVELIDFGDDWRYLDDGSNQGTAWSAPAFDDSAWAEGPARLGYGEGFEATILEQGSPRHITYYFRRTITVADPAAFTSVTLEVVRDDGAVVYVNGVEVARSNMPAGPIAHDTLAPTYATGAEEITPYLFTLDPSALQPGANVIAVEIHSADQGSADLGFDLHLRGEVA